MVDASGSGPAAPAVSVIVPAYNHAPFLPERIDSILNQTFQDFELILLDDHSTDRSAEVLQEYVSHEKTAHCIVNDTNSGIPCAQWERGIQLARGEFVWIAESDDTAQPEFLQTLVDLLNADDRTVVAYCRSRMIDADGQPDADDFFWADDVEPGRWHRAWTNRGADEIERCLSKRNTIPSTSAVVFRREAALQVEIPMSVRFVGDWLFWMRLLKLGDIAYSPRPLSGFRMHEATTRTVLEGPKERQRFIEYLIGIQEAGGEFCSSAQPAGDDHSWILTEYESRFSGLPWWILSATEIPMRLRRQFLVHTAARRASRLVSGVRRWLRIP